MWNFGDVYERKIMSLRTQKDWLWKRPVFFLFSSIKGEIKRAKHLKKSASWAVCGGGRPKVVVVMEVWWDGRPCGSERGLSVGESPTGRLLSLNVHSALITSSPASPWVPTRLYFVILKVNTQKQTRVFFYHSGNRFFSEIFIKKSQDKSPNKTFPSASDNIKLVH